MPIKHSKQMGHAICIPCSHNHEGIRKSIIEFLRSIYLMQKVRHDGGMTYMNNANGCPCMTTFRFFYLWFQLELRIVWISQRFEISARKNYQVFLEKSSIEVSIYLLLVLEGIDICAHKSEEINWSGQVVVIVLCVGILSLCIFPSIHELHTFLCNGILVSMW